MPKKTKTEIKKMKTRLRPKAKKRLNKLIAILLFLLKFNLLAIPMYLLMYLNISVPELQSFVANAVHALLSMLGYSTVVEGYIIKFAAGLTIFSVDINFDCTGWKSMYALFALVIATPVKYRWGWEQNWKQKLKFLAIGLPAIFIVNIFRIATTIAVAMSFGAAYLDIVHTLLWQEGLIIAVVAIWYLWLRRVNFNII